MIFELDMAFLTCCNCAVVFGFPKDHEARLRQTRQTFYCPNGHGQSFTGKTEAEKLREQLEAVKRTADYLRTDLDRVRADRDHAQRQVQGYKGAFTKAKKQVERMKEHCDCPPDVAAEPVTEITDAEQV